MKCRTARSLALVATVALAAAQRRPVPVPLDRRVARRARRRPAGGVRLPRRRHRRRRPRRLHAERERLLGGRRRRLARPRQRRRPAHAAGQFFRRHSSRRPHGGGAEHRDARDEPTLVHAYSTPVCSSSSIAVSSSPGGGGLYAVGVAVYGGRDSMRGTRVQSRAAAARRRPAQGGSRAARCGDGERGWTSGEWERR